MGDHAQAKKATDGKKNRWVTLGSCSDCLEGHCKGCGSSCVVVLFVLVCFLVVSAFCGLLLVHGHSIMYCI